MSGGGGQAAPAPTQQTVTQTQQLPAFEQQFAQENQDIARSIGSQPFPVYQGQMIAPMTDLQNQAIAGTPAAAAAYQAPLQQAAGLTGQAATPWSNAAAGQYMNPFVMQALAPQLQALQQQQQQNQLGIDRSASQAGAFGDARNGAASALNNFFGGLQQQDVIGQGLSNAYNTGLSAFQNDQNRLLGAGAQYGNIAGAAQNLGLTGQQAIYGAGQQQQNLQQEALNNAFQQFLNQQNWPQQMLNTRLSALSNSPYNLVNFTTLPPTNSLAQNLGAFGALAGGVGSLFGGGQSGARAPFGGAPVQ